MIEFLLPAMILEYGPEPGLRIEDGILISWPESLGDEPTENEQNAIVLKYQIYTEFITKKSEIKSSMYVRIEQGITWKYNGGGTEYNVSLDDEMHNWMIRQLAKFNEGRVDPHNGFVQSNSVQFNIDDDGLKELCLFSGMWGDAISAIRITETSDLFDLAYPETPTGTELTDVQAYNVSNIDWSVTWSVPDQNNGWSDNALTQTP